jgi:hypothetical protein
MRQALLSPHFTGEPGQDLTARGFKPRAGIPKWMLAFFNEKIKGKTEYVRNGKRHCKRVYNEN